MYIVSSHILTMVYRLITNFLLAPHALMAYSEVETLFCPDSMLPSQGFYVELLVIRDLIKLQI